jgi:predicted PurR-regulated permease PerM
MQSAGTESGVVAAGAAKSREAMITSRRAAAGSSMRPIGLLTGTVAVLYLARQVFIPLAVALTLAFLLAPVVAGLQKCRMSRVPAVIVVVLVAVAAVGAVGWSLAGQLLNVVSELPQYRENIHNKIEAFRSPQHGPLGKVTETVKDIKRELSNTDTAANPTAPRESPPTETPDGLSGLTKVQVVEPPVNAWQYLQDFASPLIAPVAEGAVVLIFAFVMLVKKEDLRNRLLRLAGVPQLNVMTEALDDAASRVSRYLLMQGLINATFGVLFGTGLYFIGLPNAALWGVLAGTLRIVPYVGTLVAGAFPLILSLAVFDSWAPPLLVLLLYAGLELSIANIVEPWLYGTRTGISPLAILVAAIFWATLWGPAGLILSTPLTVCLVVLGRYVPQLSFLHILLGDQPVLAPEARLYQRLLAMDQAEARKGSLDQAREEFLFLTVGEMIAEFSEHQPEQQDSGAAEESPSEHSSPAEESPTGSFPGRVICVPVSDQADQLTAAMLAQLLDQRGYSVISFPAGTSLGDLLALKPGPDDIIFTSAVPPFAFAHSKTLHKQLASCLPKVRIVVGIWGFSGDTEKAKWRFERQQPETIVTTISEAVKYVAELGASPR